MRRLLTVGLLALGIGGTFGVVAPTASADPPLLPETTIADFETIILGIPAQVFAAIHPSQDVCLRANILVFGTPVGTGDEKICPLK